MMSRSLTVTAAAAALVVVVGFGAGQGASASVPDAQSASTSASSLSQARTGAASVTDARQGKGTNRKGKGGKGIRFFGGVTLSNPLNATNNDIARKIHRAIRHTPDGARIRAASWNINSTPFVNDLIAAHRRGVSVQVFMARSLANEQTSGGSFATLKRNLSKGNKGRPGFMRSWIRTCSHSCRGKGGAMHSKYYIFSRVGRTPHVVINTTFNLTSSAAAVQWNDSYTAVNRTGIFRNYMSVFHQAKRDKPANYRQFKDGNITGWFYPQRGSGDLVMRMLNRVSCKGAKGAGIRGRTAIRVAQDVFNNKRGVRIAKKLKSLQNQGCNLRVIYSQAVADTRPIVQSLPNNHLVQDTDGDGAYDRYLHAKSMTISGHYGKKRDTRIVLNGSANWSGTAIQSDEQGMIIENDAVEKQYSAWINQMYRTRLVSARPIPGRPQAVDPYVNMES